MDEQAYLNAVYDAADFDRADVHDTTIPSVAFLRQCYRDNLSVADAKKALWRAFPAFQAEVKRTRKRK